MIEARPSVGEQQEATSQLRDGLDALRDPLFVQEWLRSEEEINKVFRARRGGYQSLITESEDTLNELYESEDLLLGKVEARGRVYTRFKGDNLRKFITGGDVGMEGRFLFAGISFAPVKIKHDEVYKASFRLLPTSRNSGTSRYYMPLDDTQELWIPHESEATEFDPTRIPQMIADIALRSREYRQSYDFVSKNNGEKIRDLEELGKVYTAEFAPLIRNRTPLIVNTDHFKIYRGSSDKPFGNRIPISAWQKEKETRRREMIAGRLVRIAFRPSDAMDADVPPFAVLENAQKDLTYTVALTENAHFQVLD